MSRPGFSVPIAAFFLIFPLSLHAFQFVENRASDRSYTINGNVYYADGNRPAENIAIELHDSSGILLAPEQTSGSGWFEFRRLMPGNYALVINIRGYEPVNMPLDLTYSPSKAMAIYLKPIAGAASSASAKSVSAHELSMPQKARELMDSGKKKHYQGKDATGALEDFEKALSLAPGYYEVRYQMAMAYLTLGKREDAEANFKKSIDGSGDKYGEADVGLGTMILNRGDFAQAEKTIRRGVELSPEFWLGHYELGRALLGEKRIPDAQLSAEQARALAPAEPLVYRLLSNIHLQEKDYPALLADIDTYLKLDPDSPAGIRAKQLREQVEKKIASLKTAPAAEAKP
jgi:tetratricopeptide (TPR) repeat protein